MQGVLSESILTIAVVFASVTAAAVFMQNVTQFNSVQLSTAESAKKGIMTSIKVTFASNSSDIVRVWVKNVGQSSIMSGELARFDLFFGPVGNFSRIPYGVPGVPSWNYTIAVDSDGDTRFDPGETIEINISLPYELSSGDYYLRIITHNGISDDYYFTV